MVFNLAVSKNFLKTGRLGDQFINLLGGVAITEHDYT